MSLTVYCETCGVCICSNCALWGAVSIACVLCVHSVRLSVCYVYVGMYIMSLRCVWALICQAFKGNSVLKI